MEREKYDTVGIGDSPMIIGISFSCPDGQRKEFIQGWAQEMEAWIAALDEEKNSTLLVVSLEPCGGQATYRTADDVPLVDVPCPCGDPNHWLIRWEGEYG